MTSFGVYGTIPEDLAVFAWRLWMKPWDFEVFSRRIGSNTGEFGVSLRCRIDAERQGGVPTQSMGTSAESLM
jgi:hypothetical protein